MEVLDSPIVQEQPVLLRKLSFLMESLPTLFSSPVTVVWMQDLKGVVGMGDPALRIQSKNSEQFLGPVDRFTVSGIVSETSGVAQLLRFSQISLTALESFLGSLAVLDVGARAVPPQEPSLLIPERIVSHQEPAILSVFSSYSCLHLNRSTVGTRPLTRDL